MDFVAWSVFLLVTGYTVWDGVRRTRGAKDLEGFFAAGRSIPWWAAGLSVMATQLSAITLIGGVGMGYENGLEWVQFYFALPFAMVLLCLWFVPMYRQHPVLTAYEYLERRFGPVTRTLTSITFLVSRCLAFAVVLYAPAVVFSAMTGVPITPMVIAVGIGTTAYTVAGGVGGVVWTDVKQMAIIVVGLAVCLGVLLWETAGALTFGGVFQVLGAAGRLNAVEVANPAWTFAPVRQGEPAATSFWSDEYNLWTGLFGTLFLFLSYFGCDQSQVQSILTSRSADASRRALLMSAFTKVPLQLLVLLLGGLLFVHQSLQKEPLLFDPAYRAAAAGPLPEAARQRLAAAAAAHDAASGARREAVHAVAAAGDAAAAVRLTEAARAAQQARAEARAAVAAGRATAGEPAEKNPKDVNYVFPTFLFEELPKPVLGLMIAAIFAAAISSAAGALSSLTAASMIDLYRRLVAPGASEEQALRQSRRVMAAWGLLATFAAVFLGDGPLLEQVNKIGSWFYGSILGVFLLARFVPRATGLAATTGLVAGLVAVFAVDQTVKIAYLWYNLVGVLGCVGTGLLVAVWRPAAQPALPATEPTTPAWRRTYAAVIAVAVVVMVLLWALGQVGARG